MAGQQAGIAQKSGAPPPQTLNGPASQGTALGAPTSARLGGAPTQPALRAPTSQRLGDDPRGSEYNEPGQGSPGFPGGPPIATGTPAAPGVVDQSITDFGDFLAPIQGQLGGIAQDLISRGQGDTLDPLIEAQRRQGLMGQSAQLGRAGVTGSTADNAAARMSSGFDMQQLAGRNQALESGVGLLQGTAQNALAVPGLNISALAAQNAGGGGGKK